MKKRNDEKRKKKSDAEDVQEDVGLMGMLDRPQLGGSLGTQR